MPRTPIHGKLLRWYDANKRDLPWRTLHGTGSRAETKSSTEKEKKAGAKVSVSSRKLNDPYAVWVSEIMLQQTLVATVIPYYLRWMKRFPNVKSLAAADEQEILSYWQGLGYYRRCRMLHQGAAYVVEFGFPKSAHEWMKVPGIGRYTAGAIASIAQGEQVALVDGNVERVFARLTGDASSGKQLHDEAWEWAIPMVPKGRPGDWNQALMELGATVCKPVAPLCDRCPLARDCSALANGLQNELPTKSALPKTVRLSERVVVSIYADKFGLRQIPEGKWWHGMWEFPRISVDESIGDAERVGALTYQVTNHRTSMEVFVRRVSRRKKSLVWYRVEELEALPMPAPQRKALRMVLSVMGDL